MLGMFAIISVTGLDHTGIIAAVATACAELNINIHNVSQTLMDDYFTMILHVKTDGLDIATIQERMNEVAEREQLVIRIQSQAIFDAMNVI